MLERGQGTTRDGAKAVEWYEKAAGAGQGGAQVALAVLYAMGTGVPRNALRALMWLEIADASGADIPPDIRAHVAKSLSAGERKKALKLARQWLQLRQPGAAKP
jgi:hypothetical protein